jgi:hypothetical protein
MMENEELEEITKEAFIQAVERMVLEYQCKDFHRWHYYRNMLQEVDPHNPLLEVGFHGLPYFGGLKD